MRIGPGLTLPVDEAVSQTFGILAMRGAGKTYTAKVLTEEFVHALKPVCVLDPLGVWWGLRSSADGKKAGMGFTIFGGDHADVPLVDTDGEVVADFVADEPTWTIIDLSHMRKAEMRRFATAFLARLYHRNRFPLHLVVDEADLFAPQKPRTDETTMLGAMEDLVRRGRAKGIGTTLITQRAAVINKDVLTQVDTLFTLRMSGPQDIKAIDTWVQAHGTKEQRDEMLSSLASQATGTAWVWSPSWLGIFKQVKVRRLETFDSSATPRGGKAAVTPRVMAEVDLDEVKKRMEATIEKVEANDPKKLHAEIRRLQLQQNPMVSYMEKTITETKEVVPLELTDRLVTLEHELSDMIGLAHDLSVAIARAVDGARAARVIVRQVGDKPAKRSEKVTADGTTGGTTGRTKTAPQSHLPRSTPSSRGTRPGTSAAPAQIAGAQDVQLRAGARRLAAVLADHYPMTLPVGRWRTLAKLRKGGTYDTYMSDLRKGGYFVKVGAEFQATQKCIDEYAGQSGSTGNIVEDYRRKLRKGARTMFDFLRDHPNGVTREDMLEAANLSPGGTSDTYFSDLRKFGLMERGTDGLYYPTSLVTGVQ